ncbi:interleukin-13 receptor subunit alpha-2 isoform X2 [Synchiropus splendidus]|uniref:interleukin-13 receptor subunit alpha-2 isoform X2 n=1 Tax=Synchiropus splendidus TaxID=270530 RepID=UPI00237D97B0|nr:interleukin-13 receptor subunit alpha-2 isoform X2 [Synchiropus splendidus]
MEMTLSPLGYFLLSSFLLLSGSENGLRIPDVCQGKTINDIHPESSSVSWEHVDFDVNQNFSCLLHTSDILNCSWTFPTLQPDLQLYSSVCEDDKPVGPPSLLSRERVGWKSVNTVWNKTSEMILLFNMTLNDSWGLYSFKYDTDMLEVLSPPANITASVNDGVLTVRWAPPYSRFSSRRAPEHCFQYQLGVEKQNLRHADTGALVGLTDLGDKTSYMMPNADPSVSYLVRLRVKKSQLCFGSPQWSDWTLTATVGESNSMISLPVIISITLVVPMLLLSLLLFLRLQRVSDMLFPEIPNIPKKYKHFIEKGDTNVNYPADPFRQEEEITMVEESTAADM